MAKVTPAADRPSTSCRSPVRHTERPVRMVIAAPMPNSASALTPTLTPTAVQPLTNTKGSTGIDRAKREEHERRPGSRPGRAAEVRRIDAELLAGEDLERRARPCQQLATELLRLGRPQALRFVDELQLLALVLGRRLELVLFGRHLALGQLAGTGHADPLAEGHREGPGDETGDAREQHGASARVPLRPRPSRG